MDELDEAQDFTLTVNGAAVKVTASADMPLLWALRQEAGLSGTKFGCGAGLCGACTVHLDGAPARSCQVSVADAAKNKIATVEGIARDPLGAKLQAAWLELDVMQCGYCQAGQLMTALALLREKPKPSLAEIDAAMDANLCRCATYNLIRKAVLKASGQGGKA